MDFNENIANILADNYFQAASSECDMFRITTILEEIRQPVISSNDLIKIEERIEIRLGESLDKDNEFGIIRQLQEQIRKLKREIYKTEIEEGFKLNEEKGWEKWIEAFGFELTKAVEDDLNFLIDLKMPKNKAKELQKYKKLVLYVIKERWAESVPLFKEISVMENISKSVRGELHALTAQIYLYHLWSFEKALKHIEELRKLLPNSPKADRTLGEYHIQNNAFDEARSCLQKAIDLDKNDYENYLVLGNLYKAENRSETAENWYNEGIRINPGKADLYNRILLLNEHKSYYKRHKNNIDTLLEKIIKLDTEFTFTAIGNAGFVHQKNGNFEKAEEYYLKVIDIFPDRILGYINLAYSYLDKNDYTNSEKALKKSIELDPEAFDSYWGLVTLYRKKENWNEVISNLKYCEKYRPEWNYYIYNDYGNAYENLKDFDNAQKYYLLALKNDPEKTLGLDALVDIAEFDVEMEMGLSILQDIKEIKGADFEDTYNYSCGTILFKNKQYTEAVKHFENGISLIETDPVKLEYMGLAYEKSGNLKLAESTYRKAIDVATTNKDKFYNRLAFFLTNQKKCNEAISILDKAIELQPEPLYYENRGYAHEILEDFTNAELDYNLALKLATKEKDIYENRLGVFYYNQQKYDKAILYYTRALKQASNSVYYENIGLAYEYSGDLKKAEDSYKKALEASIDQKDIYLNRIGIFHYNQLDYKQAINYYKQAINNLPKTVYYENLGKAYYDNGDYKKAEKTYLKIHSDEPDNYIFLEKLGLISQNLQNFKIAVDYFNKALLEAPEHEKSFFYNYIGNCWFSLKSWNDAAEFYKKAIERDSTQNVYFDNLILALKNGNRKKEAIQYIENKLENTPSNYTLINQLGLLLIETGEVEKAANCFKKNITIKPSNSLGYDNLGYAYELLSQFEEAVKVYIEALRLFPNESVFIENFGNSLLKINDSEKKHKYYNEVINIGNADKSQFTYLKDQL